MSNCDLTPDQQYAAMLRLSQRWAMTLEQVTEHIDSMGLLLEMVLRGELLGQPPEGDDD